MWFCCQESASGAVYCRKVLSESNAWSPDLHIPIHTNAFNGETLGGTLVMIYSMDSENKKAGQAILDSCMQRYLRGLIMLLGRTHHLSELNSTKAVAVYVEVEFHDTVEGATVDYRKHKSHR